MTKLKWFPSQAAQWFARHRLGSAEEQAPEFKRWLAGDARHTADYEALREIWDEAGELADDPSIQHAVQEAFERPARGVSRRALWAGAAAAAAAAAVGAVAIGPLTGETVATAIGEQRTFVLDDRSAVTLNAATRLIVRYSASVRRIDFRSGEAFFEVAHDDDRPFRVVTDIGSVSAVGTEFAVYRRSGSAVTVDVLAGRVRVTPGDKGEAGSPQRNAIFVDAGERVTFTATGQVSAKRTAQADRIEAWRHGRLLFQSVRLQDAVDEMSLFSHKPIVIAEDDLRSYIISGQFRVGAVDEFLVALREAFGIVTVNGGDKIVLISGPQKPR